jgi:hypothetical protein
MNPVYTNPPIALRAVLMLFSHLLLSLTELSVCFSFPYQFFLLPKDTVPRVSTIPYFLA